MADISFPQVVGISQLADETAMVDEEGERMFVRSSVNVDIDKDGNFGRRPGATLKLTGAGYHSLYKAERGWLVVCYKSEIGVYDTTTETFTALVDMDTTYRTSFTEANGILYASNPNFSCMFLSGNTTAKPIGVPLPTVVPQFAVLGSGGMEEGTYGVAYTIVDPDGEESGLSDVVTLDLEANQGVQGTLFTVAAGYKYRVYMTVANGEELRQAMEFDADTASIQILVPETGRLAETFGLEPLPYGHIIRAFNSRLIVGSTDYVYFSEAFRPHLAHPTGHVQIAGLATMVEAVGSGVFIGDKRGVRFYRGEDPSAWTVLEASPEPVIYGTSAVLSGSFFTGELQEADKVAIWLTTSGYQVGLPTGEVLRLNAEQVKLPAYSQGCATVLTSDGRKQFVTPVNSNELAHASVALDSTTL
jgi:hypothetical protein